MTMTSKTITMTPKQKTRHRRGKNGVPVEKSKFTPEELVRLATKVGATGRKRERDDVIIGLYAKIEISGLITFHVDYKVKGDAVRYHLTLGALDEKRYDCITIEDARKRADIVKMLAVEGTNVRHGLHKRLMEEIDAQGAKWSIA
jgi:hypothetical protein